MKKADSATGHFGYHREQKLRDLGILRQALTFISWSWPYTSNLLAKVQRATAESLVIPTETRAMRQAPILGTMESLMILKETRTMPQAPIPDIPVPIAGSEACSPSSDLSLEQWLVAEYI